MKILITVFLFGAGAVMARVESPLPSWDAEERAKIVEDSWMAGGVSLNCEPIPDEDEAERPFLMRKEAVEEQLESPSWMKLVGAVVAAGFGGTLVLCSALMWWRRRARFRFPEFEVEPRLGGSHAAGIGAVISFGSAAIPPAMQREQLPDYMRRA